MCIVLNGENIVLITFKIYTFIVATRIGRWFITRVLTVIV
jgi:hypothetical protein